MVPPLGWLRETLLPRRPAGLTQPPNWFTPPDGQVVVVDRDVEHPAAERAREMLKQSPGAVTAIADKASDLAKDGVEDLGED